METAVGVVAGLVLGLVFVEALGRAFAPNESLLGTIWESLAGFFRRDK